MAMSSASKAAIRLARFAAACLLGLAALAMPVPAGAKFVYSSQTFASPVFSPDGKQLALGFYFEYAQASETFAEVEIYDTAGQGPVTHFWQKNWLVGMPPEDLAFSPDGSRLAATWYVHEDVSGARGSTVIWDLSSAKSLPLRGDCGGPAHAVAFLDGERLMLSTHTLHSRHTDFSESYLCELGTGTAVGHFPDISYLRAVPELNLLIGSGYHAQYDGNELVYQHFVRLFDSRTYRQLAEFPRLTGILSLSGQAARAVMLTESQPPRQVLVDLKQRKIAADLGRFQAKALPDGVDLQPLPDGRELKITAGDAKASTLLELRAGKQGLLSSRKLPAQLERFALSPDKTQLALLSCSSEPDTVCELGLWRLSDLRLMRSWPIEIDPAKREQPPE